MNRVVHIINKKDSGGAYIAAERLHSELASIGVDSRFLSLMEFRRKQFYVKFLFSVKIRLIRAIKRQSNRGLFSLSRYGQDDFYSLRSELNLHDDIIVFHWWQNSLLKISSVRKLIQEGYNCHFITHDNWLFTAGCHYTMKCENYRNQCKGGCPHFSDAIYALLEGERKDKMSLITAIRNSPNSSIQYLNSDWLLKFGTQSEREWFFPNVWKGYNSIETQVNSSNREYDIAFGALGGKQNPFKGYSDLQWIVSKLGDKSALNIRSFGGKKEESFDGVMELGVLSKSEILDMFLKTKIFIFPSLQESYGQTLIEAMYCGSIVVARETGIVNDIISHGYNGFVFKKKEEAFAILGELLTLSEDKIEELRQNSIVSVRDFNSKYSIKKWYEKVLSSRNVE